MEEKKGGGGGGKLNSISTVPTAMTTPLVQADTSWLQHV